MYGHKRFHLSRGHRGIIGESLLQAWFLLMNGIFFLIMRELGLDSFGDLLGCADQLGLAPSCLRFSEEEYVFLREYDLRAGMEPLTIDGFSAFPPIRIIAMSHYLVMIRLLSRLGEEAKVAFKSLICYLLIDGSMAPKGHPMFKSGIIDSHLHMDRLSGSYHTTTGSLKTTVTDSAQLIYGNLPYINWAESVTKLYVYGLVV